MTQTPILAAMQAIENLNREIVEEGNRHEEKMRSLQADLYFQRTVINNHGKGLYQDLIDLAKTVLYIRGRYANAGEDRALARHEAMQWLARPELRARLFNCYIGTKSYDRWHGQRISPPYGSAPTHGTVIFAIELQQSVRERDPNHLTDQEVEAALYLLSRLEDVQAAELEAQG